ncbi:hypothetical protein HRI_001091900 [Hibiscus trionum]|uniref:HTH myb-type domain-containing protein n=1 Tax=Hibiscus trionum TaxID=183268 RepID=A0A9W7LSE9_HIBTR|nr:hypothetical protein HRI_001091900 [Hibiscus trionum]
MQTSYSGPYSFHNFPSSEPMELYSAHENSPTPYVLPQYQQPEAPAPAPQALMFRPHAVPQISCNTSHNPGRFNTGLNPSLLPNSKTGLNCPSLSGERNDFMGFTHHVPAANPSGNPQVSVYAKPSLTLKEQLQLQYLSKELEIDMNEDENIDLDQETHGAPHVSAIPGIHQLGCKGNHLSSVVNMDGSNMHPMNQHSDVVAAHKQRIRWIPELHELFLNAVDQLGGPESATPKNILNRMNVEGLNIYHVKSHLQKYRLAKDVSELKHDKRSCKVEEKKATLIESDLETDGNIERDMNCNNQVVETLRMQVQVQKLLHDQLKVQRELQLQIEQQGQLLKKLMDERLKSGSASADKKTFPNENPSLFSPETASFFQKSGSPKSIMDCSSSTHSPKLDASQPTEFEQCRKRNREGSTKPTSEIE